MHVFVFHVQEVIHTPQGLQRVYREATEAEYAVFSHLRTSWPRERYVLMPMIVGNHWWLTAFDLQGRLAYVYDSRNSIEGTGTMSRTGEVEAAARVFEHMRPRAVARRRPRGAGWERVSGGWRVRHMECPQQHGDVDCGVYVIHFMRHLFCRHHSPPENIPTDRVVHIQGLRLSLQHFITQRLQSLNHRVPQLVSRHTDAGVWDYKEVRNLYAISAWVVCMIATEKKVLCYF